MLDLIELALKRNKVNFQRIDGQTSLDERREALRNFNAHGGFAVMLASIGSCGEGYDDPLLVFCSVIMGDPD